MDNTLERTLSNELTPAEVIMIDQPDAVTLLKNRAPALIEQYQGEPETLAVIAAAIENAEPLPLVPELPEESPFPVESLLGMDDVVFRVASETAIPPALIGQCVLGLANSITHGLVDVKKPSNPRPKPTSLFFLAGAASGEGKTWADNILSGGLHEVAYQKDMAYNEALREYRLEMKAYRAEQRKIETDKKMGQAERTSALKELERPEPPMNPRLKCADFTIEGLGRAFRDGCTRLSAMTDEGAIIFEGHTLNNDRKSAVMGRVCKLWDGEQWDNDRGQEENNYTLYGRRLAVSITTQPDILNNVMADTLAHDQGFLPRFLVSLPGSRIAERTMIDVDWHNVPEVQRYWARLAELYSMAPTTADDNRLTLKPRVLTMTPEAQRLYMAYGNKCLKACANEYASIRAMTLKAEDNLLRLAATLAVWNNPHTSSISHEYIEAATYLMDYYLEEALRVIEFSSAGAEDSDLSRAAELMVWLKKEGRYLLHSSFLSQKAPRGITKNRSKQTIEKLMSLLVEHGQAIRLEGKPMIEGKPRQKAWLIIG